MEMTTGKQNSGATNTSRKAENQHNPETLHTISTDEAHSNNSRPPRILGSLNHNFNAFKSVNCRNQIVGIQKTTLNKINFNQSQQGFATGSRRRVGGAHARDPQAARVKDDYSADLPQLAPSTKSISKGGKSASSHVQR